MSLGKIGAFCGCGEGMGCADCQEARLYPNEPLYSGLSGPGGVVRPSPKLWYGARGMGQWDRVPMPFYRGMGAARWAGQTNYWPSGIHRRYAFGRYHANQSPMQTMGMKGFGEVSLGGGWTLGDLASLALVALSIATIWEKAQK